MILTAFTSGGASYNAALRVVAHFESQQARNSCLFSIAKWLSPCSSLGVPVQ
jgi:hypothetical protein